MGRWLIDRRPADLTGENRVLDLLKSYFWPNPPKRISAESETGFKADLLARELWSGELEDKQSSAIDVWTKHADNLARAENRAWFREHGMKFVRRWATMSFIAFGLAWLASGSVIFEVPFALTGLVAGGVTVFFQFLRRII